MELALASTLALAWTLVVTPRFEDVESDVFVFLAVFKDAAAAICC
jgi:hypothetical protein